MRNNNFPGSFFQRRLQVLLNLCPAVLELQNGDNPLHNAAFYSPIGQYECFISVLMAGIRKLTKNNGILLLFRSNGNIGHSSPLITPFNRFIYRWSREKGRWSHKNEEEEQKRLDAINNALNDPILCCHNPPYDTAEAIFEAATSEQISLDGVFFFLRREPDVLQKLLLGNNSYNDSGTTDNTNHTTKRNNTATPNISTNANFYKKDKTK